MKKLFLALLIFTLSTAVVLSAEDKKPGSNVINSFEIKACGETVKITAADIGNLMPEELNNLMTLAKYNSTGSLSEGLWCELSKKLLPRYFKNKEPVKAKEDKK